MDDYKIALGALLDANAKGDINKQLNAIKDLSVTISKATLSNDVINDIKRQLTQNGIDLKLVFGNVNQITNQAKQTGQQIGNDIGQQINQSISSAIQKGTMKSADGKKDLSKYIPNGKLLQNDVAKQALKDFQALGVGIVTVKEEMKNIDGKNLLNGFTINIKNAKGEVESLRYALTDIEGKTGKMFQYTGGSINDAGAIKQIKDIENAFTDYTAKLAQFKSTNTNILSGLMQPLADFESKLAGLKNGTVTIDEVKNAFKLLGTEASKITENFTGQLSKTDAAIRKLAQGDEIMDKLKASFKGLNNAPKEITKELTSVSKLLQNVKNIESTEGRTANWSAEYRKWSDEVDKLQAKLSVLQKQQANMTTPQIFKTSELRDAGVAYMTKVSNTINKQMPELQKMLNAHNWNLTDIKGIEDTDGKIKSLTLTVRDAEGALKQFVMQRAKLDTGKNTPNGLMQVGDVKILETASQAQEKLAQSTEKANTKLAEQANKIQLSMGVNGDTTAQIDVLRNNFTKLGLSADEVKTKMSGVDAEVKTLQSLMNSGADNSAIVTQFEKLQTTLTQTQNNLKQTRSDYSLLATEQQRLSLANTIEAWNQKNTRATKEVRVENDRYVASLRDLNTQMTKLQFGQIQTGFKQNENSMRTLNRLGASLKDQMKQAANSFTQWISVSSAIMGVVYNTKQAVSELKDLDDILTEISKTSDLTTEQLKNLGDTAFDTASKYGKKASDYLTGVQEMYRAGFDNAEQMAELSVLAQSAGDMDATLSNNYLMATNAAYKYKGSIEDLNNVLDSQNYITNNAAISMKDIADATTETASVAAEFGVQIDELSALIATATANTRESGSEVGTALKAILINLQDTTSKPVTDTFDALGISMTKVVDGAEKLKTPIELIYELADAYNSLPEGDVMRANILNDIGQKRHAKVCVVI